MVRAGLCLLTALAVITGHVALHGEHVMYKWTILENDICLLPSPLTRVLSYGYVHANYLWKLVWPFSLCYDYGFRCIARVEDLGDPKNMGTLVAFGVVLGVALMQLRFRRALGLWAVAFLIVPMLPASNILFPVGTILGERLLYVPSVGYCLFIADLLALGLAKQLCSALDAITVHVLPRRRQIMDEHISRAGQDKPRTVNRLTWALALCAVAYWTGMSAKTVQRNREWATELALFESAMDVCPQSLKVLNNLALRLLNEDPKRAGQLLDRALSMDRSFSSALFNRGLVHHNLGEHIHAITLFQESIRTDPKYVKARACLGRSHYLLGVEHKDSGQLASSFALLRAGATYLDQALRNGAHNMPFAYHNRANIAFELEDWEAAVHFYTQAIHVNRRGQLDPTFPREDLLPDHAIFNMLGVACRRKGDPEAAIRAWNDGLSLVPDSFEIYANIASFFADRGEHSQALNYYARAVEIAPNNGLVLNNIGWMFEQQGNLYEAAQNYRRAIELLGASAPEQILTNLRNVEQRI